MTTPQTGRRPSGLVVGSLVAISFGTVFVLVNSGGLAAPWPLVIRVAGILVAALLVVALLRVGRRAPAVVTGGPAAGFMDRRYWIIVAIEVVALFGGLNVINRVLDRPALAVAWVAVVVGVHFFGLGWIWRMPRFHWLGVVMTVLGLAGFLVHALGGGADAVALVAGVGSGAALYATVALALRDVVATTR
ncbi:hypothetical protein [Micromonospora mirobrigensis]|uniref:Uncharacterized protein n=1 Tax=Micromonospora mirobrigensis TaxID=262898 RepID=A0A1C4ZYN6_9ACTN|nr:hypothetical protein [Micromonospora mirobrigensis]SCF37971.1 hypothetical protein GA0070564_10734 [Micromonospora mirobrigensis]